jgi:hypothetical protein
MFGAGGQQRLIPQSIGLRACSREADAQGGLKMFVVTLKTRAAGWAGC